jgi:hypothetical protein
LFSFTADAFEQRTKNDILQDEIQEWKGLQEKGLLLFRETKILRCSKTGVD